MAIFKAITAAGLGHSADGYLLKLSKNGQNSWKIDEKKGVLVDLMVIDATVPLSNQIVLVPMASCRGVSKTDASLVLFGREKNTIPSATVTRDLILVGYT